MRKNFLGDNMDKNELKQKKGNKKLLIILFCIFFFLIIAVIIFFLLNNNEDDLYYGKWKCNDEILIEIDKNKFNMDYISKDTSIEATYVVDEKENSEGYRKYTLNVSAVKRIINGTKYTDPYTTQYQIVMRDDEKDSFALMNTISYSIYSCERKK